MILNSSQIEEVVRLLLKAFPRLQSVHVFGSGAGEDFIDESDVDLAIVTEDQIDAVKLWDIKHELANLLHREVDLVDLKAADTVFQLQVVYYGTRIYERDYNKAEAFETLVFSMYLTLNEDRKYILEDIAKDKTIHG